MFRVIVFLGFCFLSTSLLAQKFQNDEVDQLLAKNKESVGVVFEIMTWDKNAWEWAAPMVKQFRQELLAKYSDLDIAIVSHGGEQFDLTKEKNKTSNKPLETLKSLSNEGVDVHVCGTHSSWQNVSDDAYVEFIDVSPSAPAQINDYIKLGYVHVTLRAP